MQVNVFNIDHKIKAAEVVESAFSFHVFIKDITRRSDSEQTIKAEFYKFALDRINQHPELKHPMAVADAVKYKTALELVYTVVSPSVADESDYYWGIASPIPGEVVYGTDALQDFMNGYNADPKTIINQGAYAFNKRITEYTYRLVLEKLYHISSDINTDTIYIKEDEHNGLEKYYKIHIDNSYVDICVNQHLPELKPELIEQFLHEGIGAGALEEVIPLSMFRVEGFSIVTVEDFTAEQSLENIRLALVNDAADQNNLFERVAHSLQTLTGNRDIEFGLLPFLKVNGKLIYETEECFTSVLINAYVDQEIPEDTYGALVESYMKDPKAIFYNEIKKTDAENNRFLTALYKANIISYAVLPVYYNRKLAGVMEIYSKKSPILYEQLLSKIEVAVPLLSQLLHNSTEQFNERIEDVIKDKFTTLQQSVEWKFNEVAWNYIRDRRSDPDRREIKTVGFKDVDPLYGAVDIRNSTAERNLALQHDLGTLLTHIKSILTKAVELSHNETYRQLIEQADAWHIRISKQITDNDELNIKIFFESKVYPVFDELEEQFVETSPLINAYFQSADEVTGDGFAHRRQLEDSISMINTALNNYYERAHGKLQEIYPCYFETFRTDGVEYDIYTGQSLAPDKPYHDGRLQAFREWQVKSMIDIVNITHKLTRLMTCKLQTTQLIFVHSGCIDICFRKDERRFDVEGAYNVRYEVIKKRIDKVLIKGTDERLTQPGKIALVYSSTPEADEFLAYIKQYQEKDLLSAEIEHYDLEELQGVTGLKAIRVSVVIKN